MSCPFCGSDNSAQAAFCRACGAELPRLAAGGASADALPVGALLANTYAVESVLGQGGFGITYCAHDQMLDRRVAIKEFFPAGCRREDAVVQPARGLSGNHFSEARSQFLAEARLLARCHHAGIVGVHTAFEANSTAYMVMELLHGSHLAQLLDARGGPLPEAEAVALIERAGQALQFVHDQGLLHRDIKPENIIVCDDGRVMLIDFGTAREYAQGQAQGQAQGHTIVVTPGYAPLEQYARQAKRGAFTDVYGLAATLYHLLTGQAPPAASDRAVGVQLRPVREENWQISAGVARATEAGLEMEIAKRPQSVREFLELMHAPAIQTAPVSAAFEVALMPHENAIAKAQREALLALSSAPAGFFSSANEARQQMLNEALADPQPTHTVQLLPLLASQQVTSPSIAAPPAIPPFASPPAIPSATAGNRVGGILNKPITVDNAGASIFWWLGGTALVGFLIMLASSPQSGPPYNQPPIVIQSSPNYSSSTYSSGRSTYPTSTPRNSDTREAAARKEMESTPAILPASVETLPISVKSETKQRKTAAKGDAITSYMLAQGLAEFSPDGQLIAYMDKEATVRVWSLAKHRVVSSLPQPKNHPPVDIRFSPDAKNVALTYQDQSENRSDHVTVWNLATEKALGTLSVDPKKAWLIAGAVLSDGKLLIAKTDLESSQERLFLWDPRTGKQSAAPIEQSADVYDVVVSFDGQQMITGDKTGLIRWSDPRTGGQTFAQSTSLTYRDFQDSSFYDSNIPDGVDLTDPLPVEALRLSRNGSYLASLNAMRIRVFDSEHREVGSLPVGNSPAFAVSPDGVWVVEGSNGQNYECNMLWNVRSLRKIRLQGPTGLLKAWSFSADGKQVTGLLSSPEGASLVTWRTDAEPIAPFSAPRVTLLSFSSAPIQARTMSPSNRLSARQTGHLLEIRRFNGSPIRWLEVGESPLRKMAFSPNGQLFSGQTSAGETRIWNVESGQQVAQLEVLKPLQSDTSQPRNLRSYVAQSLVFSPDGSLLARAGRAGGKNLVEVWSLKKTPHRIAEIPLSQPVTALTFSADDGGLIYSEVGGGLSCYDIANGRLRAQTENGPALITYLSATEQGLAVVSTGTKGDSTTLVTSYDMPSSGESNGLSSGQKRKIFGGKKQVVLEGVRNGLSSMAFSPDGRFAASSSHFNSSGGGFGSWPPPGSGIRIWHLPTGALMQTLPVETIGDNEFPSGMSMSRSVQFIEALEFSSDGSQLHCISLDPMRHQQQTTTWQCPPRQTPSP